MLLLGILCAYQVIIFSVATTLVPECFVGVVTGVINGINMSFGYVIHRIVAKSIYTSWDGALNDTGAPIYSKASLVYGLMPIPMMCVLGSMGFLFLLYYMKGKNNKVIDGLRISSAG